jgi:hypothetical protein
VRPASSGWPGSPMAICTMRQHKTYRAQRGHVDKTQQVRASAASPHLTANPATCGSIPYNRATWRGSRACT